MKHPDRYVYPAVLTYAPGEEIAVVFPDLDAATSGADDLEAVASARELLGCVLYGLEQDGLPIPAPSPVQSFRPAENEAVMLVDVYMPAVRLAENNRSVSRTVTLPAWLNAAALANGVNFSQVLQDALKQQLHTA
ncbi:MAG: type II toxin-antitoxin system HicB family antitoxin [Oscillospiraceae bacterium]|nr:type II toxin-antitoxin system HicB family antitoxin [Oscillospiraceae bacterium]